MELLHDLFVTASLALVLSFVVAKLLSMAMADGPGHRDSDEPIIMEEVRSGQQLRVQSPRSERKAEFLVRKPPEKVHEFSPIQVESNMEIEHNRGDIVVEPDVVEMVDEFQVERQLGIEHNCEEVPADSDFVEKVDEFQVERHLGIEHNCGELTVDSAAVEFLVMSSEKKSSEDNVSEVSKVVELTEESLKEKTTEVNVLYEKTGERGEFFIEGCAKQSNREAVEEISEESTSEEITVVKSDEKERNEEREVTADFEEDDWEGIERSDLEKVFIAATEFVVGSGSGNNNVRVASIGSDVQMELYGLHKVATEGPCREPQPMPLRMSARSKWNAWQKLGNMIPEVAMEHYVTLLSHKVPRWMEHNSPGKSEQEPRGSDLFGSTATDLNTSLSHQQNLLTQRTLDQQSDAQDSSI